MVNDSFLNIIDEAKAFILLELPFETKKRIHIAQSHTPIKERATETPSPEKKEELPSIQPHVKKTAQENKQKTAQIDEARWEKVLKKQLSQDQITSDLPSGSTPPIEMIILDEEPKETRFLKDLAHAIYSKIGRVKLIVYKTPPASIKENSKKIYLVSEKLHTLMSKDCQYFLFKNIHATLFDVEKKLTLWKEIELFCATHLSS